MALDGFRGGGGGRRYRNSLSGCSGDDAYDPLEDNAPRSLNAYFITQFIILSRDSYSLYAHLEHTSYCLIKLFYTSCMSKVSVVIFYFFLQLIYNPTIQY